MNSIGAVFPAPLFLHKKGTCNAIKIKTSTYKYNNGRDYSYNTGCMQKQMHEQPDLVELWKMPAENGVFKEIRTLAPPKSRSTSRSEN